MDSCRRRPHGSALSQRCQTCPRTITAEQTANHALRKITFLFYGSTFKARDQPSDVTLKCLREKCTRLARQLNFRSSIEKSANTPFGLLVRADPEVDKTFTGLTCLTHKMFRLAVRDDWCLSIDNVSFATINKLCHSFGSSDIFAISSIMYRVQKCWMQHW